MDELVDSDHKYVSDWAMDYYNQGWAVIPVEPFGKAPLVRKWQELRLTESDIARCFSNPMLNVGLLTGEPSGWTVDVDIDHPIALKLADQFLPHTDAVFGRRSKPRSHRLFHVTSPVKTKQFRSKKDGMIVELRSTNSQTVLPPSFHADFEPISWENPDYDPAQISAEELIDSIERLADAVRLELGELVSTPVAHVLRPRTQRKERRSNGIGGDVAAMCLARLRGITHEDQNDGSFRLLLCARLCVEYDVDDDTAVGLIRLYAEERPFPRNWSDEQILRRIRDAESRALRGDALARDSKGHIRLGQTDPDSGRLVLSPRQTLPTAESFVRDFCDHPRGRTLQCYGGTLMRWEGSRYKEVEDGAIQQELQVWLHKALRYSPTWDLVPFDSNPGTINAALESLRSFTYLPALPGPPCWLGDEPSGLDPRDILPCHSGLLHLPTMKWVAATPKFFSLNAIQLDPDFDAPPPSTWLNFLDQIFGGEKQSIGHLQEWCGYCLTGDTSQQKMLLIVGPKRSGKGTINRVMRELIGEVNTCGPTTSGLASSFGLQTLIGKTLATVSDARFHGDNVMTLAERLLCISGEDPITVDRKYLDPITLKLSTRFMFLSNELPRFRDASGALASRFLILRTTQSFYGKEDLALADRLMLELPGILSWAIEGWQRLNQRGHFEMPNSVQDMIEDMVALTSPVIEFIRERCLVATGMRIPTDVLYNEYKNWCEDCGRRPSCNSQFGCDLAATGYSIRRRKGTNNKNFYDGITIVGLNEFKNVDWHLPSAPV